MRRAFDAVCAALGLIVLAPLLAVIALATKLGDGGPVLYSQLRMGRNFRRFRLYKFRSMVPGADRLGMPLTHAADSRVTRVGSLLRRYKLDELPQLLNVLKGDMQLVGARPEVPRYVDRFRPQYALILRDRPGITDPAALAFRNEERLLGAAGDIESLYVETILPRKIELSLRYSERRSFVSDLQIIFKTVLGQNSSGH